MQHRLLGKSEVRISAVAIGCWAMGGTAWGPQDDEQSISAVGRAVEVGVNLVDTAPVYGRGHSEEVVGRALLGIRDRVVVATKWGLAWNDSGRIRHDASPARLAVEIEASRKRLGIDTIDLYQLHWPDPDTPIAQTAAAVGKLHESGVIRAIGVSNYSAEQMTEWMKHAPLHCLQPPFSMFKRGIEREILPFCIEHNIATIVYSPLYQGLLTGKFNEQSTFADLRSGSPDFAGERFKVNLAVVDRLKQVAERHDRTVTQLVVNWTIHVPGITAAICGARKPSQIEESAGGADWELSSDDLAEIDDILAERERALAAL